MKRYPYSLKKRLKRKLVDSKVKNEKNLECALSFVEGSEPFDNIVLTADVRQTARYIRFRLCVLASLGRSQQEKIQSQL